MLNGVARVENDGRIIEDIDLLCTKFFGFEAFDLNKWTKSELYSEVLRNIVVNRFLRRRFGLRNEDFFDHLREYDGYSGNIQC